MRMKVIKPKRAVTNRRLRVCAYVRVSTKSEEQENSLDNQARFFEDFIRSNPAWELMKVYCDNGISGFCNKREQFQEMLQDARDGKIDFIIVKSVSRFARNTETMLEATRELKKLGIGVLFLLQNINTSTEVGELMLTIYGAFAQAESDQCSEMAKVSIRRRFEQGKPISATYNTFGYRRGQHNEIEIVEEEARVVRLIFDLAGKGVWPTKIRDYLNEHKTPAAEGGLWNRTGIARVLQNPMYKGDLLLQKWYSDSNRHKHRNNGEFDQFLIEGNHPAIVSAEEWEKAQDMLSMRSEGTRAHKRTSEPKRSSHYQYSLSGLLFCPCCGDKLIHKSAKSGQYWACRTNLKVSAGACKGIWLPETETAGWDIHEPVVPVKYKDEYGMTHFTAFPLEEYRMEEAGNE